MNCAKVGVILPSVFQIAVKGVARPGDGPFSQSITLPGTYRHVKFCLEQMSLEGGVGPHPSRGRCCCRDMGRALKEY